MRAIFQLTMVPTVMSGEPIFAHDCEHKVGRHLRLVRGFRLGVSVRRYVERWDAGAVGGSSN